MKCVVLVYINITEMEYQLVVEQGGGNLNNSVWSMRMAMAMWIMLMRWTLTTDSDLITVDDFFNDSLGL